MIGTAAQTLDFLGITLPNGIGARPAGKRSPPAPRNKRSDTTVFVIPERLRGARPLAQEYDAIMTTGGLDACDLCEQQDEERVMAVKTGSGGALSGNERGVKLSPYLRGELTPEDQRQGSMADAEKASAAGSRRTTGGAKLSPYFLGERPAAPELREGSMADGEKAPAAEIGSGQTIRSGAKMSPYLRGEHPIARALRQDAMPDAEKAATSDLSTGHSAKLSPYLRGETPVAKELREGSMADPKYEARGAAELSPYLRREFPVSSEAEQMSGAGAGSRPSTSGGVKLSPYLRGEHPIPRQTRHSSPSDAEQTPSAGQSGISSGLAENMEVLGSDGQHVGVIDHIEGDSIELKKDDPAAHGAHHFIPLDWVASVDTAAKLKLPAAEAWTRWTAA